MGFLGFASEQADRPFLDALRKGLTDQGYVEGQTILLEARHARGDLNLAAQFIDEMVRRPVDVFVAPGPAAARAIRRATPHPNRGSWPATDSRRSRPVREPRQARGQRDGVLVFRRGPFGQAHRNPSGNAAAVLRGRYPTQCG